MQCGNGLPPDQSTRFLSVICSRVFFTSDLTPVSTVPGSLGKAPEATFLRQCMIYDSIFFMNASMCGKRFPDFFRNNPDSLKRFTRINQRRNHRACVDFIECIDDLRQENDRWFQSAAVSVGFVDKRSLAQPCLSACIASRRKTR